MQMEIFMKDDGVMKRNMISMELTDMLMEMYKKVNGIKMNLNKGF